MDRARARPHRQPVDLSELSLAASNRDRWCAEASAWRDQAQRSPAAHRALDRIALSMPRLPAIRQGLVSALKAGTMWSDEAESGSNSSISTSCLRSQQMAGGREQHRFRALTRTTS